MYTQLSKTGNASATKGLARVIGLESEFQRSERTCVASDTDSPTIRKRSPGLAAVLSWQGRQEDANRATERRCARTPPTAMRGHCCVGCTPI